MTAYRVRCNALLCDARDLGVGSLHYGHGQEVLHDRLRTKLACEVQEIEDLTSESVRPFFDSWYRSVSLGLVYIPIFSGPQRRTTRNRALKSSSQIEGDLREATEAVSLSLQQLEVVIDELARERELAETELAEARVRYERLAALAENQEQIAEAHRAILEAPSLKKFLLDQSLGFLLGVTASIAASLIMFRLKSRESDSLTD